MEREQHLAQILNFLTASDRLQEDGLDLGAAEMIWGATVQGIYALYHLQGSNRHPNTREYARIISQTTTDDATRGALDAGFTAAKDKLHNHFYTGRLDDRELEINMGLGKTLVGWLLAMAGWAAG